MRLTSDSPTARPLRRDAAEHREQLLAAALKVFDAHGLDASVTEIARVAGVGVGTLYRNFPTKEALIDALVHQVLDATITMAREATALPDGSGLEHFLEASASYQAKHVGCLPRLWDTDLEAVTTARALIALLLTDAKKHHRIRKDLTPTDVSIVLFALRGIIETTQERAPDAWRRHLDILIAGMRPAEQDLAHRALTPSQLNAIVAGSKRPLDGVTRPRNGVRGA